MPGTKNLLTIIAGSQVVAVHVVISSVNGVVVNATATGASISSDTSGPATSGSTSDAKTHVRQIVSEGREAKISSSSNPVAIAVRATEGSARVDCGVEISRKRSWKYSGIERVYAP